MGTMSSRDSWETGFIPSLVGMRPVHSLSGPLEMPKNMPIWVVPRKRERGEKGLVGRCVRKRSSHDRMN